MEGYYQREMEKESCGLSMQAERYPIPPRWHLSTHQSILRNGILSLCLLGLLVLIPVRSGDGFIATDPPAPVLLAEGGLIYVQEITLPRMSTAQGGQKQSDLRRVPEKKRISAEHGRVRSHLPAHPKSINARKAHGNAKVHPHRTNKTANSKGKSRWQKKSK